MFTVWYSSDQKTVKIMDGISLNSEVAMEIARNNGCKNIVIMIPFGEE